MIIHNSNNFRTEYHPRPDQQQIDHGMKLLTIGSCFSENIGQRLLGSKFQVLANPLGTVYNPLSIFNLLKSDAIDPSKFVEVGEQWYHLDFHSQFTGKDKKTLDTVLNFRMKEVSEFVAKAQVLFVTLGTSFVYESVDCGEIVANCHKLPQKHFTKRLLTLEEMKVSFDDLKNKLEKINPALQYIFTVSPVRHIKDGIAENQLSKSLLRVLCHELTQHEKISYFPAYEMMMDDLRDYRFYKTDMIHPSEMAEEYIWQKFQHTYFSEQTRKVLEGWGKIQAALAHRPFQPESQNHQKFIQDQLRKLEVFSEYFDVETERTALKQQML